MKSKVRLLLERYCTVCENYDSQSPILSEIKKYKQAILQNARNLTANEIEQATLKSQAVEKKKLLKQLIEDIVIPDISE